MQLVAYSKNPIIKFIQQAIVPPKKTFEEISSSEISQYYTAYNILPYNPDTLSNKEGKFAIYDKMRKDEQVKVCLAIRKLALLADSYTLSPASDAPEHIEQCEFINYNLEQMKGTIEDKIYKMLQAYDYGFSITEKLLYYIDRGKYKGKIGLKNLKTRKPHNFDFKTDNHGNLLEVWQWSGTLKFDPVNFVLFPYNAEWDNPYGNSDLIQAYRAWWSKDLIMKFWNIYIERYGHPFLSFKYDPENISAQTRNVLTELLNNVQSRSSFAYPKDLEMELKEVIKGGEDIFDKAIIQRDKAIAKALLLPGLMGFTETSSGSFALGKKQFDVFYLIVKFAQQEFAESIMAEQIIRPLIDMNYANVEVYPVWKFGSANIDDQVSKGNLLKILIDAGIMNGEEDWVREYVSIPRQPEGFVSSRTKQLEDLIAQLKEKKAIEGVGERGGRETIKRREEEEKGREGKIREERLSAFLFADGDRPSVITSYEKKVAFANIENTIEVDCTLTGLDKMKRVFTETFEEIKTQFEKNPIKSADNIEYSLYLKKYQTYFEWTFQDTFSLALKRGSLSALEEIGSVKQMALHVDLRTMPPVQALAYIKGKSQNNAGKLVNYMSEEIKKILFNSIKAGKSSNETISDMAGLFDEWQNTNEIKDGKLLTPSRLETVLRTGSADAFNVGRLNAFLDPQIEGFVEAFLYSAILDGRTTELCGDELDGLIIRADDSRVARLNPPNHWNCRSLLVPITAHDEKYEVWDDSEIDVAMAQIPKDFK